MKLSIIIPIKDDLRVIKRAQDILHEIRHYGFDRKISYIDITVVDDGYNETIKDQLDKLKVNYIYELTKGKGSAVSYGLKYIDSDYFLIIDSDDSINIDSINSLINLLINTEEVDLIYGVRIYKNINNFRRIIGLCQLFLANILVLKNFIQDTQCPLKCLSRRLRNKVIDSPKISGGMYDVSFFYICELNKLNKKGISVDWNDSPSIIKVRKIIISDIKDLLFYRLRYYLKKKLLQNIWKTNVD
jgi:glycosyltransferase involved in cell wall biosynthesis